VSFADFAAFDRWKLINRSAGAETKEESRAEDGDLARWRPIGWSDSRKPHGCCCWLACCSHADHRDHTDYRGPFWLRDLTTVS
jgi:hypothetical protein